MSIEDYRRFVAGFDGEIAETGPRSMEMIYEDAGMTARTTLALDDRTLVTEIHVHDVSRYDGTALRALLRTCLAINAVSTRSGSFDTVIDPRGILVLRGRTGIAEATPDRHAALMEDWLEQAARLRDLARAVGLEGNTVEFFAAPESA